MFTYKYKIKFSDCDPGGVIYFANIFNIAHQAYEEFLLHAGGNNNYFSSRKYAIPIVKAEAFFLQPLRLHEEIRILLTVESIGNSSYTIKYKFVDGNDLTKTEVITAHVVITKEDGNKTGIPEDLRNYLITNLDEKI
jgi:1,4-dihydroxy-2-naphthoyl-CoA hydrolase